MQNPFQDVMELDRLSPKKDNSENRGNSDNDSLEPPFEIHGIPVEEENDAKSDDERGVFNDNIAQIEVEHHPLEMSSFGSSGNGVNPPLAFPPITPSERNISNQDLLQNDVQPMPVTMSVIPQPVAQTMDIHDYHSSSSSDDDEAPHSLQFEQQQKYSPERHPLIPQASGSSSPGRNLPYDNSRFHPLRLGGNGSGNNSRNRTMGMEDQRPIHIRPGDNRSEVILGWKDVYNMDDFLDRLYQYYEGKGFLCIVLLSISNLLTVAFVVGLSVFLSECIDYSKIPSSNSLQDVIISNCPAKMSWITTLLCIIIGSWWSYVFVRTALYDIPRLAEIKHFVNDILNISEQDLQTLLWRDFTSKVVQTYTDSQLNVNGRKLDAYIIANRIMRKDNYIIALFNKEILDLSLPYLGKRQWLTRMMQDYIIYYGILGYVYDEKGLFKKRFKKESNRMKLAIGLKKRFRNMAALAIVLSPVLFIYLIVQSFFKISEEYRQNPALLSARAYSPIANWKLREYNELSHLFNKRITRSHDNATKYMLQFPNHVVVIIARFISFISGSLAAVLVIITLFDEKFQQGFEITSSRSALFYIGIFGSILAVTQAFTQENIVHEPQRWMNEVVLDTHYLPDDWRDQAHLPSVRNSFAELFHHKIILLMYELLSVFLVPLFLYTRLTDSTLALVDFFREYTVKIDSIGHICSYAVFDFGRHGDAKFGSRLNPINEKLVSKNGKMEQSFINFKSNNPDWDPGLIGSQFLTKVVSKRPYAHQTLGNNISSRIMAMSQSELGANSVIQGDSLLMSNLQEGEADVVRELIKMLDAIYAGNQRI